MHRAERERGTVLVMVVALLVVLFVAGIAFLNAVAFRTGSLAREAENREAEALVSAVEDTVLSSLRNGWLDGRGNPYNADLSAGLVDTNGTGRVKPAAYGTVAGVHPISSVEPYWQLVPNDNDRAAYLDGVILTSNGLVSTRQGLKSTTGTLLNPGIPVKLGVNPELMPQQSFPFKGTGPLDTSKSPDGIIDPDGAGIVDADGDGIADAIQLPLPASAMPAVLRRELAERLSDPNLPDPGDDSPIYLSLRVIPHGAMVDVNHGHKLLIENVFGVSGIADALTQFYSPATEEPLLRNRMLLPPRPELRPPSSLQELNSDPNPSSDAYLLLEQLPPGKNAPDDYQWWGYDVEDCTDPACNWNLPVWAVRMTPWENFPTGSVQAPYDDATLLDKRHLVTTYSVDDLLIRGGRDPATGRDWVEQMREQKLVSGEFAFPVWRDYPTNGTGATDKRNGRVQVSLPEIDAIAFGADPAGIVGIDGFATATPGDVVDQARVQVIEIIQAAFLLMLRNNPAGDFDLDDTADNTDAASMVGRYHLAASLTANLLDYADRDDVPTVVQIRDFDGNMADYGYAVGVERHPYISEVVADTREGPNQFKYAVEIHNPYGVPISLQAAGSDYVIRGSVNGDVPLTGTIGPKQQHFISFSISTNGTELPPGNDPAPNFQLTGPKVTLVNRRVMPGLGVVEIPVDQATTPTDATLQRDTENAGGWRVTVPMSTNGAPPVPGAPIAHTLGAPNDVNLTDVRPVKVEFASTGRLTPGADLVTEPGAFPTTGSLLLLVRTGAWLAPTLDNPTAKFVAFNRSFADIKIPAGTPDVSEDIDNGRLPIFDVNDRFHDAGSDGLAGLPWGQLIFDYFTALPLDNAPPAVRGPNFTTPEIPYVDRRGLRVYGRININAAPWEVLQGLPLVDADLIPDRFQDEIQSTLNLSAGNPIPLDIEMAKAIVAYREAREINPNKMDPPITGDYGDNTNRRRQGTGFLSVGELANVWHPNAIDGFHRVDSGELDKPDGDFVKAAALLIALDEWVTVKSHVFTIYGTLRGQQDDAPRDKESPADARERHRRSRQEVNGRAIRFQETVDRSGTFFTNGLPQRIGRRIEEKYPIGG